MDKEKQNQKMPSNSLAKSQKKYVKLYKSVEISNGLIDDYCVIIDPFTNSPSVVRSRVRKTNIFYRIEASLLQKAIKDFVDADPSFEPLVEDSMSRLKDFYLMSVDKGGPTRHFTIVDAHIAQFLVTNKPWTNHDVINADNGERTWKRSYVQKARLKIHNYIMDTVLKRNRQGYYHHKGHTFDNREEALEDVNDSIHRDLHNAEYAPNSKARRATYFHSNKIEFILWCNDNCNNGQNNCNFNQPTEEECQSCEAKLGIKDIKPFIEFCRIITTTYWN